MSKLNSKYCVVNGTQSFHFVRMCVLVCVRVYVEFTLLYEGTYATVHG